MTHNYRVGHTHTHTQRHALIKYITHTVQYMTHIPRHQHKKLNWDGNTEKIHSVVLSYPEHQERVEFPVGLDDMDLQRLFLQYVQLGNWWWDRIWNSSNLSYKYSYLDWPLKISITHRCTHTHTYAYTYLHPLILLHALTNSTCLDGLLMDHKHVYLS